MTNPQSKTNGQITTREELIFALSRAAELEHGLMCIYLFAAYSMKTFLEEDINEIQRNQIRNWEGVILAVAKQEMEHLGMVCNMLNAIGAPQHFDRPNLPQPASYYDTEPFVLERFGLRTMKRFMEYEKPAATSFASAAVRGDQLVPDTFEIHNQHTVQELYNSIQQGFVNLSANPNVEEVFIGPEEAQIRDSDIVVGFGDLEYGITMVAVTDLESAKRAIDEIIEQGEGIDLDQPPPSEHGEQLQVLYQRIVNDQEGMSQLTFDEHNWRDSGNLLIAAATLLLPTLEKAFHVIEEHRKTICDAELALRVLATSIGRIRELKDKATDIVKEDCEPTVSPSKRLSIIRDEMVDIIKSDVAGAVLSGFINTDSHYLQFWRVYEELNKAIADDCEFRPGRNAVTNPALRAHADNSRFLPTKNEPPFQQVLEIHIVTHPYSRRVMELFNASYETTVQMLILFFSYNRISDADRSLLANTAFFPFMTLVVRPLSEMLTLLPAFKLDDESHFPDRPRAGPPFEYYIDIAFLPNREAGWIYLNERLGQLADFSRDLSSPPPELENFLGCELLEKLTFQMETLHTNLRRIAENFKIGTTE